MTTQGLSPPVRLQRLSAIRPTLELVQPRADGLKNHPALKAVGGVGREQEAAVSDSGSAEEAPEGRAGF
jgi:hypothetical protein